MQHLRLTVAIVFGLSACAAPPTAGSISQVPPAEAVSNPHLPFAKQHRIESVPLLGNGKIQHVVIIVQENRTTDNLFHGLPGADTATDLPLRSAIEAMPERT